MATKLSAVSQKTGTNADDLVYIASTSDSGSTYESKAIKIENLFSSVASGTDLGSFTGSTLSDNASVKTALQELETALEAETSARGTAITAAVDALVDSAPGTLDTLNELLQLSTMMPMLSPSYFCCLLCRQTSIRTKLMVTLDVQPCLV